VEAAPLLWNKILLASLHLVVMFSGGGGGPVGWEPSGSGGPMVTLVRVGSCIGVYSHRLLAVMAMTA
jgi:hypothetical protein